MKVKIKTSWWKVLFNEMNLDNEFMLSSDIIMFVLQQYKTILTKKGKKSQTSIAAKFW